MTVSHMPLSPDEAYEHNKFNETLPKLCSPTVINIGYIVWIILFLLASYGLFKLGELLMNVIA